jgi:hypothetical protein
MKSTSLESRVINIAQQRGIDCQADPWIYFKAPKKGPGFPEGPYTLIIQKHPRLAPYIVTLYELVREFNRDYTPDQILVRNSPKRFEIEFTPLQFAQAFGGVYHIRNMTRQLAEFVDKEDDTSKAVVQRLKRIPEEFFCVGYVTESRISDYRRVLCSDEKAMESLAGKIPKKYRYPRAGKEIRALEARRLTYIPLERELFRRFARRNARFIVLKGYDRHDKFKAAALNLVVEGRHLALAKLPDREHQESIRLAPAFDHRALWKALGEDILLAYSLMDASPKMVRERLRWTAVAKVLDVLRGFNSEKEFYTP